MEWEDFQTTLYSPFGIGYIDNIAGAESTGLELELNAQLTQRLRMGLSYSYTKAETTDPFEQVAGDPSTIVDSGTDLPGTLEHQAFANVRYDRELPGGSSLVFYADVAWRGDTNSAFRDQPAMATENFAKLDSYTVWNSSLSWMNEGYTIGLFGENLSNERATSIITTADFVGAQDAGYGVIKPRTYGIRFKWSY